MFVLLPPTLVAPVSELDRETLCMGTRLRVQIQGPGNQTAASESAFAEADRIEQACSTWRSDSIWSRLNASGEAQLDPEWVSLLASAKAWSDRMEGAFDPCLGRLVAAWGARQGGRMPSPEAISQARQASGAAHLSISGATVRLSGGAWIEEGGFVKGYALDRMARVLKARGMASGLLDFGGQLLAFGAPCAVTIADPMDRTKARLSLVLKDASLACSGDSERGRHLLDPRTGQPCEPWGEVAVVADTGFEADVLSKLFILGPDRGLAWADAHGVAAVFISNGGSPRLSRAFQALSPTLIPEQP